MSIIEDLYYGDYKGCELPINERTEIEQSRKHIEELTDRFAKSLSKEQLRDFKIILNSLSEVETAENFYLFKNGFELGVHITCEI